jgi:hypothetical protein
MPYSFCRALESLVYSYPVLGSSMLQVEQTHLHQEVVGNELYKEDMYTHGYCVYNSTQGSPYSYVTYGHQEGEGMAHGHYSLYALLHDRILLLTSLEQAHCWAIHLGSL